MTEEDYTQVYNRLSKIEGQVRGIKSMLKSGRNFTDVITQLSAIRSGINKVAVELFFTKLSPEKNENEGIKKNLTKFI